MTKSYNDIFNRQVSLNRRYYEPWLDYPGGYEAWINRGTPDFTREYPISMKPTPLVSGNPKYDQMSDYQKQRIQKINNPPKYRYTTTSSVNNYSTPYNTNKFITNRLNKISL